MTQDLIVRLATEADAPALAAIYEPYVRETAITFEYVPPTAEEFAERMRRTMEFYPYVVAVLDGAIVGYAYAGTFKDRPAYDWAVETSIYVAQGYPGRGIGRALHAQAGGPASSAGHPQHVRLHRRAGWRGRRDAHAQ